MPELSPLAIAGIVIIAAALLWLDLQRSKKKREMGGGKSGSILASYASDLTKEAKDENLDPVIGRDEEIERVIHILSRRRKNNPLLLGEPGVGKTAIVEGLARRINKGYVPETLQNKRVLSLDLASMISGTKYRGEFEKRMRKLTQELEGMGRTVILFIDEIHTIGQAKGSEGSMNASDILKPALARGDLQAIGATTWREFEEFIKPDDALNRRFQPVIVGEPSPEATLEILKGIRPIYEKHHGVKIDDDALVTAMEESVKIKDRFLPDKAIDLIDEASAMIAIESTLGHSVSLGAVREASEDVRVRARREMQAIQPVIKQVEKLSESFPDDIEIEKAQRALVRHLKQIDDQQKKSKMQDKRPRVTKKAIQKVIQEWVGQVK